MKTFLVAIFSLLLFFSNLFGAGEVKNGKVSAYLVGAYEDLSSVESKLTSAGFEVLGKEKIEDGLTTVIFTCPTLKRMANKPKRGFAAVMRVLVDKKDNQLTITNPLYFEKAFLGNDFDKASAKKVLSKINKAFSNLKDSKDVLKFSNLKKYHFMFGMPYYDDMEVVASGDHNGLIEKLKSKGREIFSLKLSDNDTLIGYKLLDKTSKFVEKIGTKNSLVLPYTILVEGNKAYILAAKYYLAISYPLLKMSQFMTIATVPAKITKECSSAFK